MSDQTPDIQPLDAGAFVTGTPYSSRVRSLLGVPQQSFVAAPVRLPPALDPLPSSPSPDPPDPDRGSADMDNRVEPSAIEAPAPPRSSVGPTGARDLPEADRGAISTPGPARVDRLARETSEPAVDEPNINESKISRVGLEQPSHTAPPCSRPALDLIEEHVPSVGASGKETRAVEIGELMTVEHVHVAIPGGQSEKNMLPVVEALSPGVIASGANVGTTNEADEVETPTQPAPVPRSRTMPDRYDAHVPDLRAQGAQPASTRSPGPEARLPEEETVASAPGRSEGSRLPIPSREPRDHPAEGERPRPVSVQSPDVRAGLDYERDHGVDDTGPLPSQGIRVERGAATILRARTIENPVHVPVREPRRLEQLEQKVEHLEAQAEQQRASVRQAVRPESRAAPRLVFVAERPVTTPRAYWARSHLTRVTLWPRR